MKTFWGVKTRFYAMIGIMVSVVMIGSYFVTADLLRLRATMNAYDRVQSYASQARQLGAVINGLAVVGKDMVVDSVSGDFKGLEKRRFDELAAQKEAMDQLTETLIKDAEVYGLSEMSQGFKESIGLLYKNGENLSNLLRYRNAPSEELGRFDSAIDATRKDAEGRLTTLLAQLQVAVRESAERTSASVSSLQRTGLIIAGLVLLTLLLSGALTMSALGRSVSRSQTGFKHSIAEFRDSAQRLSGSVQEISASTAETVAGIQGVVGGLVELSARVRQAGQQTGLSATLSRKMQSKANDLSLSTKDLSEAMNQVAKANGRIEEMLTILDDVRTRSQTINDVVFKAQLLSVNASIEAAKAGQLGKGFSVLATEIANLGSLSAKAGQDIAGILDQGRSKISAISESGSAAVRHGQSICKSTTNLVVSLRQAVDDIAESTIQIDLATKNHEIDVRQASATLAQIGSAAASVSHTSRDTVQLATLLVKQSDRMRTANSELTTMLLGESEPHEVVVTREPVAEAGGDHDVDPGLDKVIALNHSEMNAVSVEKIRVEDTDSLKPTGT